MSGPIRKDFDNLHEYVKELSRQGLEPQLAGEQPLLLGWDEVSPIGWYDMELGWGVIYCK